MRLRVLLLAILVAAVLSSQVSFASGAAEKKQETVVFMVDTSPPGFGAWKNAIEEATGVKIQIAPQPQAFPERVAKQTTILSTGDSSVDILNMEDEGVTTFTRAGFLAPLSADVMTPDVAKQFPQGYLKDLCSYQGVIYTVPSHIEVHALWINEKLFRAAGLTKYPSTRDEFLAAAQAMTKEGQYGFGSSWQQDFSHNEIYSFIYLFGGDYFNWDNPRTREALQFMYDLAHKYKVEPLNAVGDGYDPLLAKYEDDKYGMMFFWSGVLPKFAQDKVYGSDHLHMIPMLNFGTNDALMASWHFGINKASKNMAAAKKVLSYLASAKGAKARSLTYNQVPTRQDLMDDPDLAGIPGIQDVKAYFKAGQLRGRPFIPRTMELIKLVGGNFERYIQDQLSLDDYCKLMNDGFKTLMK